MTLYVVYPNLFWPSQKRLPTLDVGCQIMHNMHILVCQRKSLSDNIVCIYQTFFCRCQTLPTTNFFSLHTSVCRCWMWTISIVRCIHTSLWRCYPKESLISKDMHTFDVACEHHERYLNKGNETSTKPARMLKKCVYKASHIGKWQAHCKQSRSSR